MRHYILGCLLLAVPINAETPKAKALLETAATLHDADDNAGAMKAYLEAVNEDPTVESLLLIEKYFPSLHSVSPPTEEQVKRFAAIEPLARETLRQYIGRHPDDLAAMDAWAELVGPPAVNEIEAPLRSYTSRHQQDPAPHRVWSHLYTAEGRAVDAIREGETFAQLSPCDDQAEYVVGLTAYEAATRRFTQASDTRSDVIHRGMKAFKRAIEKTPDNVAAMTYLGLLEREEARTEKDPARAETLTKEADGWKARAMALVQKQRTENKTALDRDWDVWILQEKTIALASDNPGVVQLVRQPFQIQIQQPSESAVEVWLSAGDAKETLLGDGARIQVKHPLNPHTIVYEIKSIGNVPIANVASCLLRIRVIRGGEPILMKLQFK
jgi:hypothetical protein